MSPSDVNEVEQAPDAARRDVLAPGGPAGSSVAFSLSAAEWAQLSQLVADARELSGKLPPGAAPASTDHPRLVELRSAWDAFAPAAAAWPDQGAPWLKTAAKAIADLGEVSAPAAYNPLIATLKSMGEHRLTTEQMVPYLIALAEMSRAAIDCVRWAGIAAEQVGHLAQALSRLNDCFDRTERNPRVRVMLPECGALCLSYGDDGLACAGDASRDDPRHAWELRPMLFGPYVFVASDGRLLVVVWQKIPGIGVIPSRPTLISASEPAPTGFTTRVAGFTLPPGGHAGFIQNTQSTDFTLDCAGNDGWEDGTRVLTFRVNDGPNQHWRLETQPWNFGELAFYDLVAPIAESSASLVIERLEGEWRSIVNDFRRLVGKLTAPVNPPTPTMFVLAMETQLAACASLAREARAAAGL
ncbi:MAG TPA: hypothetical protein VGG29_03825 [Caulobacteraceae bacterium]|jgi:hypothetical protein